MDDAAQLIEGSDSDLIEVKVGPLSTFGTATYPGAGCYPSPSKPGSASRSFDYVFVGHARSAVQSSTQLRTMGMSTRW